MARMEQLRGIAASPGIVIAKVYVLNHQHYSVKRRHLDNKKTATIEAELARFERAITNACDEIEKATRQIKNENQNLAGILMFQSFTLKSKEFKNDVIEGIGQGYTTEHAVQDYFRKYRLQLSQLNMLEDRISDLAHMERRVLRNLVGETQETLEQQEGPIIIVASDLDPTTTAELPLDKVVGLATAVGGPTSHTAIVAQSRNIPAVVGVNLLTQIVHGGETMILDGRKGKVIVNPDPHTLARYRKRRADYQAYSKALSGIRRYPAETLDGYRIRLFANIEFPKEVKAAIKNGADGIGLYRTEFLYSETNPNPSEDEHIAAYEEALKHLSADGVKRPLVIRTLDLGADKFNPDKDQIEMNPFLGQRSIRWCFAHPDVFHTQLRAILRVSTLGDVRIMLPMISSLEELLQAKHYLRRAMAELQAEDVAFNEDIKVGIMIEVPSAALIADVLAKEVHFFSIGTNDLVQYALAVDRGNQRVASYYEPAHLSIFRMLARVVQAGRTHNRSVSLCGEISGDEIFTALLLGLGLRDLSMAPARIPNIKQCVRSLRMVDALGIARKLCSEVEARQARRYLEAEARKILPSFLN